MTARRILVLASCTGAKTAPVLVSEADFDRGRDHVRRIADRHRAAALPAEDLYTGQHHVRLMRGVHRARAAAHLNIDLRIVSAGFGLIKSSDPLPAYERTFIGRRRAERRELAEEAGIPTAVSECLSESADLAIVLLGEDYLEACDFGETLELGADTLVFCGARAALDLPPLPRLHLHKLTLADTRRFSCGLVALKGEIGGRLLSYIAETPDNLERILDRDPLDLLGNDSADQQALPIA